MCAAVITICDHYAMKHASKVAVSFKWTETLLHLGKYSSQWFWYQAWVLEDWICPIWLRGVRLNLDIFSVQLIDHYHTHTPLHLKPLPKKWQKTWRCPWKVLAHSIQNYFSSHTKMGTGILVVFIFSPLGQGIAIWEFTTQSQLDTKHTRIDRPLDLYTCLLPINLNFIREACEKI